MSEIAGLRMLRAANPSPMTLDGTRTFVVGKRLPAVIDPGPADEAHRTAILGTLGDAQPAAILLTHAHPDHAAGAAALARATGAPLRMAQGALDPAAIPAGVERIADGEAVRTDAGVLTAVATPGHAPEHLAFLWRGESATAGGALFVGDLLMGEADTTLVAPPEGDLRLYLQSLERVRDLAPAVMFPAHGPPLRDVPAVLDRYVTHRQQRIEQAAEALRRVGSASPAELVRTVYGPELNPALAAAAAASLAAILEYLAQNGQAESDPATGRYRVAERA